MVRALLRLCELVSHAACTLRTREPRLIVLGASLHFFMESWGVCWWDRSCVSATGSIPVDRCDDAGGICKNLPLWVARLVYGERVQPFLDMWGVVS